MAVTWGSLRRKASSERQRQTDREKERETKRGKEIR